MRAVRVLLCSVVAAGTVAFPSTVPAEDLDRCRAVTLRNKPPFRPGDFNAAPYQRRHNHYLKWQSKVFASGYISRKHFYVGFTRNVCHHLWAFRRDLPQRWRVRAFQADYTFRQLARGQRCVNELRDRRRLRIDGTDIDVYRNKVWVMLERKTWRRRHVIEVACDEVAIRFVEGSSGPN